MRVDDLPAMFGLGDNPLLVRTVDATSRKSREASFDGADGVVGSGRRFKGCVLKKLSNHDHPVGAIKGGFATFS